MVDRIRELCKEKGTSIKQLEKDLGFGNGVIARWKKSKPNYERLAMVAKKLDCTVAELTMDLQFSAEEKPAPGENELSKKEQLLNLIDSMDRAELIDALKAVTAKLEEV